CSRSAAWTAARCPAGTDRRPCWTWTTWSWGWSARWPSPCTWCCSCWCGAGWTATSPCSMLATIPCAGSGCSGSWRRRDATACRAASCRPGWNGPRPMPPNRWSRCCRADRRASRSKACRARTEKARTRVLAFLLRVFFRERRPVRACLAPQIRGRARRRGKAAPGISAQAVAKLLAEVLVELGEVEALVLGARVFDLERAHQVAHAADGQPVVALLDAEDQAGAEGVATAGRVDHAALVRRRDLVGFLRGVHQGAARALGGDVGLDLRDDLAVAPAGALLQQVGLVVVDHHVVGRLDELAQLLAVEQRHGLARVEDERHAHLLEFGGVLQHALAA